MAALDDAIESPHRQASGRRAQRREALPPRPVQRPPEVAKQRLANIRDMLAKITMQ